MVREGNASYSAYQTITHAHVINFNINNVPAVASGRRWLEGALTAARPQPLPKAAQLPSTASTCIKDSYYRPAHYRHAWGAV